MQLNTAADARRRYKWASPRTPALGACGGMQKKGVGGSGRNNKAKREAFASQAMQTANVANKEEKMGGERYELKEMSDD